MKSQIGPKKPQIIDVSGLLGYLILHEISQQKLCGDDLAHGIGKRRCNTKLTPGTIYPALKKLREEGLVKLTVKGRKKIYTLSSKGKREYSTAKKVLKITLRGALK